MDLSKVSAANHMQFKLENICNSYVMSNLQEYDTIEK